MCDAKCCLDDERCVLQYGGGKKHFPYGNCRPETLKHKKNPSTATMNNDDLNQRACERVMAMRLPISQNVSSLQLQRTESWLNVDEAEPNSEEGIAPPPRDVHPVTQLTTLMGPEMTCKRDGVGCRGELVSWGSTNMGDVMPQEYNQHKMSLPPRNTRLESRDKALSRSREERRLEKARGPRTIEAAPQF